MPKFQENKLDLSILMYKNELKKFLKFVKKHKPRKNLRNLIFNKRELQLRKQQKLMRKLKIFPNKIKILGLNSKGFSKIMIKLLQNLKSLKSIQLFIIYFINLFLVSAVALGISLALYLDKGK